MWWKFTIGLILLPALAAVGLTFTDLATHSWRGEVWRAPWFWSLATGLLGWTAAYWTLPRPMWIYVFGHELTHALAVYLRGGKVYDFRVGTRGGYVKTDTVNWWITLSPYFIPLYSLIWIALWCSVNFYYPLAAYEWLLYFGVGITWGFHLTFSYSMIRLGQSDLQSQGYVFSGVIILLLNLLLLELLLIAVVPNYGLKLWLTDLGTRLVLCYRVTGEIILAGLSWGWSGLHGLLKQFLHFA